MTNALKLRERIVGHLNSRTQIRVLVATNQHCERLGAPRAGKRNDGALLYLRLMIARRFEIGRKDLQTCRSDNRVFTSAAEINVAFRIEFSDVARVNPALLIGERLTGAIPVTG